MLLLQELDTDATIPRMYNLYSSKNFTAFRKSLYAEKRREEFANCY